MRLPARMTFAMLRAYSRIAPTERGGFRLVRLARWLVPPGEWQGAFSTLDGIALRLDLGTYPDCCMAVGLYELDTYRQLVRILRPGMWLADCGANVGYFSMLGAKLVGEQGRVDAFEPDPLNRQRLESHLRLNGLEGRVCVHGVALADRAGELTLFHPADGSGNHGEASIFRTLVPEGEQYTVPAARLDEQLDGVPDLIKMDVEGAELVALEGMRRILGAERPPQIILEHNPTACRAAGHTPGDLFRKLTSIQPRYRVYWIGWGLRPVESAERLDQLSRQGNLLVRAE